MVVVVTTTLPSPSPPHEASSIITAAAHGIVIPATDRIGQSVTVASSAGMSPPPLPIILDCDPGHDDAIAITVAARHTEVLGITTVAGNAPLHSTTRNAIIMRDLLGLDAPVHAGANRPLVRPPRHADYVHGASGLDGADLPEPSGPPASHDAVGFIIDTCRDQRRGVAGTHRTAHQHRPRPALCARPGRQDLRNLADGWRHLRQPDCRG